MKMNYFVLGTNDMAAANGFYEALFAGAGFTRLTPSERMTYWVGEEAAFALATPFDGELATAGNGTMLGFSTGSEAEVERLYRLALESGARCAGAPGPRGPRYSAYVRDLDGNKLCLTE